jgi:hypothetical protein
MMTSKKIDQREVDSKDIFSYSKFQNIEEFEGEKIDVGDEQWTDELVIIGD